MAGVLSKETISGIASFSDLRVLSAGNFKITASATDMTLGESAEITVINFVFQVILNINPVQTAAFPFEVIVNLISEDLTPHTFSASISLYRVVNNVDTLIETLSTSDGIKTFTVTETTAGTKEYKAVSSDVIGTKVFVVNEPRLKMSLLSPVVITI